MGFALFSPPQDPQNIEPLGACLVRVFVFCFGFVTFYFIEVGTLILI